MNIFCLIIIDHNSQSGCSWSTLKIYLHFVTSLSLLGLLLWFSFFLPSLPRFPHVRLEQITIYYLDIEKRNEKKKFLHYVIKAFSLGTFAYFLSSSLVFHLIYVCQECEETFDISYCCRTKKMLEKSTLKTIKFHFKWKLIEIWYVADSRLNNFRRCRLSFMHTERIFLQLRELKFLWKFVVQINFSKNDLTRCNSLLKFLEIKKPWRPKSIKKTVRRLQNH